MMLNNNNDDDVAKEIATLCVTIIAFSYEISFFFSSVIQIFLFIYFSCFSCFLEVKEEGRRQKKLPELFCPI